jgi:hypothetical protein
MFVKQREVFKNENLRLQDLSSHFDNAMGWRDLFGTNLHTLKDCIAPPDTVLIVHLLENFLLSFIP